MSSKQRNAIIRYETMLQWMREVLAEYSGALTVRQLYYRLVAAQKIPNVLAMYQKVSRDLTLAREKGDIDPSKIEDRSRSQTDGDVEDDKTGAEFIQDLISAIKGQHYAYKYPVWADQPKYVEVWVEKQALQRIFEDIAARWNVVTAVAKGFSSFSQINDAAKRFSEHEDQDCEILYFGDFDPSGECMVGDVLNRIQQYGASDVTIKKIALTHQQVQDLHLPSDFAKTGDTRSKGFIAKYGNVCVELDALPPNLLKDEIAGAITSS